MTIKNWELGNWSDAAMSRISEDASGFPEADFWVLVGVIFVTSTRLFR